MWVTTLPSSLPSSVPEGPLAGGVAAVSVVGAAGVARRRRRPSAAVR
jgi:MYXO-CTERM domain-containing protein